MLIKKYDRCRKSNIRKKKMNLSKKFDESQRRIFDIDNRSIMKFYIFDNIVVKLSEV